MRTSLESIRHRAEDVAFLAATGESAVGAAERLGITYMALEKWCQQNMLHEWRTLVARNPAGVDRTQLREWGS